MQSDIVSMRVRYFHNKMQNSILANEMLIAAHVIGLYDMK